MPKVGFYIFLFGFLQKQKWIKVILLDNLFLLGSVADKILVDGEEDKSRHTETSRIVKIKKNR